MVAGLRATELLRLINILQETMKDSRRALGCIAEQHVRDGMKSIQDVFSTRQKETLLSMLMRDECNFNLAKKHTCHCVQIALLDRHTTCPKMQSVLLFNPQPQYTELTVSVFLLSQEKHLIWGGNLSNNLLFKCILF